MSKHWMDKVWSWDHCFNALALAAGLPELAWDQFQLPVRPPGRRPAPCPTRSPTPRSSTTSSSRPSTAGPCGHLRRRLPDRSTRPNWPSAYDRLARWTDFWLDRPPRPGAAPAPLPARQRQRLGQRHHLRPRTRGRDRRPRRLPRPAAARTRRPGRRAGPARRRRRAGRRTADADPAPRCWTSCGRRPVRRPRRRAPGDTWTSASLLDLMPIVLGERPARRGPRRALADRIEAHLTAVRAGHRAARPRRTTSADGYWRGPIWAPVHRPRSRTACAAPGTPTSPTRSAPASAPCARQSGFAENFDALTGDGPARPRLHLDRQRLPHPRRRPPAAPASALTGHSGGELRSAD